MTREIPGEDATFHPLGVSSGDIRLTRNGWMEGGFGTDERIIGAEVGIYEGTEREWPRQ